jgi:hypothetical protein
MVKAGKAVCERVHECPYLVHGNVANRTTGESNSKARIVFSAAVAVATKAKSMVQKTGGHEGLLFSGCFGRHPVETRLSTSFQGESTLQSDELTSHAMQPWLISTKYA